MAIYAVKDYGINNLEYWGWNLPAFEYTKIHITLRDNETGEKGEGSLFWQKPKSFDCVSGREKSV